MIEHLVQVFFETHPEALAILVCLAAILLANRKGWISISFKTRKIAPSPTPDVPQTESGRRRAVQVLDVVEAEELEMPGRWQSFVERKSRHSAVAEIQASVFPTLAEHRGRLDRLEPIVAELKADAKATALTLGRLEERVGGVKESVAEVKGRIEELADAIATNGARTHEMIGDLLGKMGGGKP